MIEKSQVRKVYISGPMTGYKDFNFPAFNAAAEQLKAAGYEVVNPTEINSDTDGDYHGYLRKDIKALCDCDGLILIKGWEASNGANLELHVAHRLGLYIASLADFLED